MSGISGRVGKPLVHNALDKAAENLKNARGGDSTVSRADARAAVAALSSTAEKAVTDQFYRFIDRRDASAGARVTEADIDKALAYAKQHLIDAYDLNGNGLSKEEIGKMSKLGRLAVEFAIELRKTGGAGGTPTALTTSALGQAIEAAARLKDGSTAYYMSESDYPLRFVAATGSAIDDATVMSAFADHMLGDVFKDESDLSGMAVEISSAAETRARLEDMAAVDDPGDPASVELSEAFTRVKDALEDNLVDLRLVKVGPKDASGALDEDAGLYNYLVLGKTRDGQIAGISFGSVET